MKQNMNHFNLFNSKKGNPETVFLSKTVVVLMLVTLLLGCGTTAYNIKSSGELNGNKLLTGRFVFYDDVHIENSKGVTVFFKEREMIRHSECFNLMKRDMYTYR